MLSCWVFNREDADSRTGGIFIRDTTRHTAYSLWFNEVWPYASYSVSCAVSRMKMPPIREYASPANISVITRTSAPLHTWKKNYVKELKLQYTKIPLKLCHRCIHTPTHPHNNLKHCVNNAYVIYVTYKVNELLEILTKKMMQKRFTFFLRSCN